MHLLITSAASEIAIWLAAALRSEHQLRLTERIQLAGEDAFAHSLLEHDASTNLLVRGLDAIIHVADPLPADTPEQQIDYLTRGTYNLLRAAVEEGVPRLIFLSTLSLMANYDEAYSVTERWRPRPTTEPTMLAKHLGESTCREFAREHKLKVVVLRLGHVVQRDAVIGRPVNSMWIDAQDVAQAVSLALIADLGVWTVCHIQSQSPQARFPVAHAKRVLGYNPTVIFE